MNGPTNTANGDWQSYMQRIAAMQPQQFVNSFANVIKQQPPANGAMPAPIAPNINNDAIQAILNSGALRGGKAPIGAPQWQPVAAAPAPAAVQSPYAQSAEPQPFYSTGN